MAGGGRCRLVPVLLVLLLVAAAAPARASLIRGAMPDQIEKYQPVDGKFRCFDGSKTIDFSQVNDNFCDCPDSSDEPGTSACPNGVFYCRNRGHEPKLLSTSFVDDGVCDCCDGSDELSGCSNTCIEKNSAKRDALRSRISEYKASLDKKAAYAAAAAGVRENIKQRHANVDGDIANAEAELEKLAADKKRVEEETEVKRAEHKKKQEEIEAKRKADAEAAAAAAAAAKASADAAAAGKAGAVEAEQAAEEQAAAGEVQETDEERGRRIASQWTNDPAAAGSVASEAAGGPNEAAGDGEEVKSEGFWSGTLGKVKKLIGADSQAEGEEEDRGAEEDQVDQEEPWSDQDDGTGEEDHPWEGQEDEDAQPAPAPAPQGLTLFDDSELRKVQADHSAAERKLAELRTEKERVNRQVNMTFNDAWAGLMNTCLSARMPQFTYKFCFFDKATQVDNGGGHETSLGVWKGFENGGTEAVFAGGDYCHKAPARSLRVKLSCGTQERAWEASEPEVCSYVVNAATPAACKADDLQELEGALDKLLAEEAALAAEIAAEDQARRKELEGMRAKLGGSGGGAAGAGKGAHDEL